ncbi:vomeronasal type-2 receptor 26-like [Lissotriton helveticus]
MTLNKGMSFVPTNDTSALETNVAFFKFMRKLRLRHYFSNVMECQSEQDSPLDETKFKPKSKHMAPSSHKILDFFEDTVKRDLAKIRYKSMKRKNFTVHDYHTVQSITHNPQLTLKQADKGGALVVMDTEYYNKKVHEHVQDQHTYLPLDNDPTNLLQKGLAELLQEACIAGIITETQNMFLTTQNPRRPSLYMTPKIHKHPTDPPFPPMVSGTQQELEGLIIDLNNKNPRIQFTHNIGCSSVHYLDVLVTKDLILHYLKHVHFKPPGGDDLYFDANGDAPATYDILNLQVSQDEEFHVVKVGKIDPNVQEGKGITLNSGAILWSDGPSQVPRSICSEACPPGYRRAAKRGEPVCCFDCIPCSQGEISNGTDTIKCLKCPDGQWPNDRRDQCIEKEVEYMTYEEPLGLTLILFATLLTILTVAVMGVFIKYGHTPIVKANNRGLSYLLLIALVFCFLCSFIFIGRPRTLTCILRQTVFGVIFSISVSSVLAKTIIVVLAFKATNPSSSARKWLGPKTPIYIVSLSSSIQILICGVWIAKSPPFPELNTKSYIEKIIFECNEGENIFFYCMMGYMGLLASISFIVAFVSRNLPGSFNEAKLITFSMLVFVSVWLSFIPAYLSTRGKYMVAVEVFAILCSSAGLLGCIFFPKCYIILVRPDSNTKGHLVGKPHLGNRK